MVKLERDDKPTIEFDGWVIGYVSTHMPGKDRWTELRIWAVEPQNTDVLWVLEVIGRSDVQGEVDRHDAVCCVTPADLVKSLSPQGKLTSPGRTVLEAAAEEDDELAAALNQNDQKVERL